VTSKEIGTKFIIAKNHVPNETPNVFHTENSGTRASPLSSGSTGNPTAFKTKNKA
jgi:phenylacetate-coenzyme A ligase PaaK-like adenylate-forming protein